MGFLGWLVVGGIAYAFYATYRSGKREGSRKGYHVGRTRSRRLGRRR